MLDPHYDKAQFAPQWEYRQPTWEMFLTIREWAQEVANIEGYPLYMVGSALWKVYPRDIDISMIMPVADFEERYGKIPEDPEKLKGYCACGGANKRRFGYDAGPYKMTLDDRIHYSQRIDFKIQPDSWFADRDKLLLAVPCGNVRIRDWKMYKRVD